MINFVSILKNGACSTAQVAVVNQVMLSKKELCPDTAKSYQRYDDCCVPFHRNLVLAQQWLVNKPIMAFTVHGFWPNTCAMDRQPDPEMACPPSKLTRGVPEIINAYPVLRSDMTKYWVSGRLNNEILWSHEWKDHGVCLSTVQPKCYRTPFPDDPNNAAFRYFNLALNQYYLFDVYNELKDNGVVPRKQPYTRHEFKQALAKWTGIYTLNCINNTISQIKFYLLGAARNRFDPRIDANRYDSCGHLIYYLPKVNRNEL